MFFCFFNKFLALKKSFPAALLLAAEGVIFRPLIPKIIYVICFCYCIREDDVETRFSEQDLQTKHCVILMLD